MKITELKDKILIAELDPEKDYICLVNPTHVNMTSLKYAKGKNKTFRDIPVVITMDVDKSIRFIEIPKKKGKTILVKTVFNVAERLAGKEVKQMIQGQTTTNKPQDEQAPQVESLERPGMVRERYWDELGIEEKLERTRALVKSLTSMLDRQNREIYELKSFVWEHSHDASGEAVVKITKKERYRLEREPGGLSAAINAKTPSEDGGKVYF